MSIKSKTESTIASSQSNRTLKRRLTSLFKHHAVAKTVQRLVLQTVRNGYSAAADMDRQNGRNL